MGDFNINKKRDLRYGKRYFCVMFLNMYRWCRFKNKDVFFLRFLKWDFLDKFSNSLFDGSAFNLF